jgi:hypothetical protein
MFSSYSNKNNCISILGNACVYDNNKIWYVRHGEYTIRCTIDPQTNTVRQQRINNQSSRNYCSLNQNNSTSTKKFIDDYVNKLYQEDLKEKQKKNWEEK